MRKLVVLLAMLTMSQPALACAMDGMFGGSHRFNPFLAMKTGVADDSFGQIDDLSDGQDEYAEDNERYESEDEAQESAEYNPRDF
ncbi:MAG: hypothetical protein AAF067_12430 [Pseudomonadota bacterium]